jgi:hypothetical protein
MISLLLGSLLLAAVVFCLVTLILSVIKLLLGLVFLPIRIVLGLLMAPLWIGRFALKAVGLLLAFPLVVLVLGGGAFVFLLGGILVAAVPLLLVAGVVLLVWAVVRAALKPAVLS